MLAGGAAVCCAERPLLLLLQLLQPLQTRAIEALTAEGYASVRTPEALHDALVWFVREEGAVRGWRRYEGEGGSIEDPIIRGPTEVLPLPPALKQHARAALPHLGAAPRLRARVSLPACARVPPATPPS